jgi:ribonuclease Z
MAATLISRGGERWLVDCGEGTQRQLLRSGLGLVDLDLLLLTHLHGDHYLGLPGLLKTYGLRGRERPLRIVGPRGLARLLDVLRPVIGRTPFPLELDELDERYAGVAWPGEGFRIEHVPARHTVPSLGFALVEDPRPGAFDVAAARDLGVEPGPAFGILQRGGEVVTAAGRTVRPYEVLGPPRPGRTVVVSGDTEPCEPVLEASRGASVLVHEATFLDEDRERARETRHSTAREAAALARDADVGLLVLTHLSSRHAPREVRAEAEGEFPRVLVPRDFDQVEVPFPERGEPIVHPARAGGARRGEPDAASEAPATVAPIDL